MNRPKGRQVLDCASPLALFDLVWARKSGRGLPQSKTLSRRRTHLRGSRSQCRRKSERRLSMNRQVVARASRPCCRARGRDAGETPAPLSRRTGS